MKDSPITADEAHVLIDALDALSAAMRNASARPWADYDGDPSDDPKVTEAGYRATLASARRGLEAIIMLEGVEPW